MNEINYVKKIRTKNLIKGEYIYTYELMVFFKDFSYIAERSVLKPNFLDCLLILISLKILPSIKNVFVVSEYKNSCASVIPAIAIGNLFALTIKIELSNWYSILSGALNFWLFLAFDIDKLNLYYPNVYYYTNNIPKYIFGVGLIIFLLSLFVMGGPTISGYIVGEQHSYTQELNLVIDEDAEYLWTLEQIPTNSYLNSILFIPKVFFFSLCLSITLASSISILIYLQHI